MKIRWMLYFFGEFRTAFEDYSIANAFASTMSHGTLTEVRIHEVAAVEFSEDNGVTIKPVEAPHTVINPGKAIAFIRQPDGHA